MKIYVTSDIHVEFHKDYHGPKEKIDLVVLAGDIHVGHKAADIAAWYQQRYRAPVILVAGNHEFYGADLDNMLNELRLSTRNLPQVHFLENDAIEIGGFRFLGCTLWSNFAINGDDQIEFAKYKATQFMTDFQVIHHKGLFFTPDDAIERFQASHAWLESELAKPFAGDTVVITHFAPHRAAIHDDYLVPGADELTPYFTSDCSDLMRRFPIKAWFYGHTHNSVDTVVEEGVRLVSNQRGYPGERWTYTHFASQKIIEI